MSVNFSIAFLIVDELIQLILHPFQQCNFRFDFLGLPRLTPLFQVLLIRSILYTPIRVVFVLQVCFLCQYSLLVFFSYPVSSTANRAYSPPAALSLSNISIALSLVIIIHSTSCSFSGSGFGKLSGVFETSIVVTCISCTLSEQLDKNTASSPRSRMFFHFILHNII